MLVSLQSQIYDPRIIKSELWHEEKCRNILMDEMYRLYKEQTTFLSVTFPASNNPAVQASLKKSLLRVRKGFKRVWEVRLLQHHDNSLQMEIDFWKEPVQVEDEFDLFEGIA